MRSLAITAALLILTGCASQQSTAGSHQQPAGAGGSGAGTVPISTGSTPSSTGPATTTPAGTTPANTAPTSTESASTPSGQPAATVRVVVRPVTASGRPASGFGLVNEPDLQLGCGDRPEPSMVSVDPHVAFCGPGAAYAVACWASAAPAHALCLRDAWSHTVYQEPTGSTFNTNLVAVAAHPQPLALLLSDGTRCIVRDMGAWASPQQHPDWIGYYGCGSNRASYGPRSTADQGGIDQSAPRWTVQIGASSGTGSLSSIGVVRAYYVGTASS